MNASLNKAAQTFKASGATGVPTLMIDGKYITSSTMAGGYRDWETDRKSTRLNSSH